jgi:hypothetical protein
MGSKSILLIMTSFLVVVVGIVDVDVDVDVVD